MTAITEAIQTVLMTGMLASLFAVAISAQKIAKLLSRLILATEGNTDWLELLVKTMMRKNSSQSENDAAGRDWFIVEREKEERQEEEL